MMCKSAIDNKSHKWNKREGECCEYQVGVYIIHV